jgi:hypothetical protein
VSELRLCMGKERRRREWDGGGEGGFYRLSRGGNMGGVRSLMRGRERALHIKWMRLRVDSL